MCECCEPTPGPSRLLNDPVPGPSRSMNDSIPGPSHEGISVPLRAMAPTVFIPHVVTGVHFPWVASNFLAHLRFMEALLLPPLQQPAAVPVHFNYEDEEFYNGSDDDDDSLVHELSPQPSPEPEAELVNVVREMNENNNTDIAYCVVCFTRQPCVIFLGCGHIVVCGVCIKGMALQSEGKMLSCPLCRGKSGFMIGKLP